MNGHESGNGKLSCKKVRQALAGYLDGALPEGNGSHAAIHTHLAACQGCRHELSRYQALQQLLAKGERVEPPPELGVQIRIAMARAREAASPASWMRRLKDRIELVRENIVGPVALPATGGLAAALLVFSVVMPSYASAPMRSLSGVSDELPAALLQPAQLESLPDFSVSGLSGTAAGGTPVLVDASVGIGGDVVDYQILSGPDNPSIRRQLDQLLLFSRFRPQTSFGRPISGGHVVMSFSTVDVRG
jgi:anti-sigma factor RsiW